jgi:hypothetical protein
MFSPSKLIRPAFDVAAQPLAATPVAVAGKLPVPAAGLYNNEAINRTALDLFRFSVPLNSGVSVVHSPAGLFSNPDLADANSLQKADALVQDAMGLISQPDPSNADRLLARAEMAQASQIRQAVADRVDARYPAPSGGGLVAEIAEAVGSEGDHIRNADAEEQQAFQLVQSSNPVDVSNGLTDFMAASGQFQNIEKDLTNG